MTGPEQQAAANSVIAYLSNANSAQLREFLSMQHQTSAVLAAYLQNIMQSAAPPSSDDMEAIGDIVQAHYHGQTLPAPLNAIVLFIFDENTVPP